MEILKFLHSGSENGAIVYISLELVNLKSKKAMVLAIAYKFSYLIHSLIL